MDFIKGRRSIRKFTNEKVSEQDIKEILEAAMSAPSAANRQTWAFVVITKRKILDKFPQFHNYTQMILQSPVAIVVCGDMEKDSPSGDIPRGYWVQDCSAATQNILLAVHAKGLGAVWCGVYPNEEMVKNVRELLNLPDHIIPLNVIPIGHPAEEKPPADRFEEERIHYNKW